MTHDDAQASPVLTTPQLVQTDSNNAAATPRHVLSSPAVDSSYVAVLSPPTPSLSSLAHRYSSPSSALAQDSTPADDKKHN